MTIPQLAVKLNEAREKDALVFLVGAGLSIPYGYPSWKLLVKKILLHLDKEGNSWCQQFIPILEVKGGIRTSLNHIQDQGYREAILKALPDLLKPETKTPENPINNKLWQLSNTIITTNYDNIFKELDDSVEQLTHVEEDLSELTHKLAPKKKRLFKIHGTISKPGECILFEEDYIKLYSGNEPNKTAALYQLRNLISNNTVVILGMSMTDPFINKTFEWIKDIFGTRHDIDNYWLTADNIKESDITEYRNEYRFETVRLSNAETDTNNLINQLIEFKKEEQEKRAKIIAPKPTDNVYTYTHITEKYWKDLRGGKEPEQLLKYYTGVNSRKSLLPYVIAEDYYIKPHDEVEVTTELNQNYKINLSKLFEEVIKNKESLIIRVFANGGTGKTTLLLHTAKEFTSAFNVVWLDSPNVTEKLPEFNNNKPLLFILDEYSLHKEHIKEYATRILNRYKGKGLIFLTADRPLYNKDKDDYDLRDRMAHMFDHTRDIRFKQSQGFYDELLKKLLQLLKIPVGKITELLQYEFLGNSNATTAIRIINLLLKLSALDPNLHFKFDWNDWDTITSATELKKYKQLFQLVASFNKYNVTPPLSFCLETLGLTKDMQKEIVPYFDKNKDDWPLLLVEDGNQERVLVMRNPNQSGLYLNIFEHRETLISNYFKLAFSNYTKDDYMYLVRNIWRNPLVEVDKSLQKLIPSPNVLINHFKNFIKSNPLNVDNRKHGMEIVVAYYKYLHDTPKAIEQLNYLISAAQKEKTPNIYALTKLIDILIDQDRLVEAKLKLNEFIEIEPNSDYIISLSIQILKKEKGNIDTIKALIATAEKNINKQKRNLEFLYFTIIKELTKLENWPEALEYSNKFLKLSPENQFALNQMGEIFRKRNDFGDPIPLLLKSIKCYPKQYYAYNELAQVYETQYKHTKSDIFLVKARTILEKGISENDKNLALRAEYANLLFREFREFDKAEKILQENIELQSDHHRSNHLLSKLYEQAGNIAKAITQAEKAIKSHSLTASNVPVLVIGANSYIKNGDFANAEIFLLKAKELKPDNLRTDIALFRVYAMRAKIDELRQVKDKLFQNQLINHIELTELANCLLVDAHMPLVAEEFILKAGEKVGNKYTPEMRSVYSKVITRIIKDELSKKNAADLKQVEKYYIQCENLLIQNAKQTDDFVKAYNQLYILGKTVFRGLSNLKDSSLRFRAKKLHLEYLKKCVILEIESFYVLPELIDYLITSRKRYKFAIAVMEKFQPMHLQNLNLTRSRQKINLYLDRSKTNIPLLNSKAQQIPSTSYDTNFQYDTQGNYNGRVIYVNKPNQDFDSREIENFSVDIEKIRKQNPTLPVSTLVGVYKDKNGFYIKNAEPSFNDVSIEAVLEVLNLN